MISIAYFVYSWFIPGGFLSETHHYYFMTTIDALVCLVCIYGVIGLCYCVSGFLSERTVSVFSKTSRNLDVIYIVQWYLIPLTYIFICFFNRNVVFGDISLIVISLLEIAAASTIAAGYKSIKKNYRKEEGHGKNK